MLIDPDCLNTLSDRAFSDGMAEVIKYGCIRDREFFELLDRCGSRAGVMDHIEQVICTCCDLKRQVVLQDERDTGLRMTLNFGHTIGHDFELAGHYETWTHGQGVAAGMNWAAQLGVGLGITPPEVVEQIRSILNKFGLPQDIPCPWETPYPQLIQKLFNAYWCGPPAGVTQPSTWPRGDHLVSRLPLPTIRPVQTRLRFGYVCRHT